MLKLNPFVTAIEEETAFTVLDRANALKAKGVPVINLGIGQPDFTPPRHILEAAEKAVRDGPHGYTSPQGLAPLRDAVAQYVGKRFSVPVSAEDVVIVPGGKVTFYFACQLFGGLPSGFASRQTYQSRFGESFDERDSRNHGCSDEE